MLVGCDRIFDLDELAQPPREAGAGNDVIASGDSDGLIACVGHNEDGDDMPDDCDTCPIDAVTGDGDTDMDRIGNRCDPHPDASGDSVVFFAPFVNLDGWIAMNGVNQAVDNVVLQVGYIRRSFSSFEALRIPLSLTNAFSVYDAFSVYIDGGTTSLECRLGGGACPSTGTGDACMVVSVQTSVMGEVPLYFPITNIARFEVYRSDTTINCGVRGTNGALAAVGTVASIGSGYLSISANNYLQATLYSAILYGR